MKVTNVEVRYGRSRQPAKYESADAAVTFTATLEATIASDTDHVATAIELLGQAKTIVLTEMGLVAPGASASAFTAQPAPVTQVGEQQQTAVAGEKPKGGRRKADQPTPPATPPTPPTQQAETALGRTLPPSPPTQQQQQQQQPAAQIGGIPAEPPASSQPGAIPVEPQKPAAQIGDIPVGDAKPAGAPAAIPTGDANLTAAGVQKYITTCLVQKKFLPNVVLGMLKSDYKADRVQDLNPQHLAEFYAKVKKIAEAPN